MNRTVNKLKKRPFIIGVSRFYWMDKVSGSSDYSNNQLCKVDESYQTPWIIERAHRLTDYDQKVYNYVDKGLKEIAEIVYGECEELATLSGQKQPLSLDKENTERESAKMSAELTKNERRRREILIHLAVIKADVEAINTSLEHHLQRAEKMVLSHVSAYWRGVLKSAESENLPPTPKIPQLDAPGKKHYEVLLNHIMENLDNVLV